MKNIFIIIKNHKNIFVVASLLIIIILISSVYQYMKSNNDFNSDYIDEQSLPQNATEINANTYTEAIKKSDISLCDEITDIKMRDTCVMITQGKIDYAENQNTLSATSTNNNLE